MEHRGAAFAVNLAELGTFVDGPFHSKILAASERTAGTISMADVSTPEAAEVTPHIHRAAEELFYVIEGRMRVKADGDEFVIESGGLAFVPRGTYHAYRADTGTRYLVITYPGFFDLLTLGRATGDQELVRQARDLADTHFLPSPTPPEWEAWLRA